MKFMFRADFRRTGKATGGRSAGDTEGKEISGGRGVAGLGMLNVAFQSLFDGPLQAVKLLFFALDDKLDAAVREVANIPGHGETRSDRLGGEAEPDPLHASGEVDRPANRRGSLPIDGRTGAVRRFMKYTSRPRSR